MKQVNTVLLMTSIAAALPHPQEKISQEATISSQLCLPGNELINTTIWFDPKSINWGSKVPSEAMSELAGPNGPCGKSDDICEKGVKNALQNVTTNLVVDPQNIKGGQPDVPIKEDAISITILEWQTAKSDQKIADWVKLISTTINHTTDIKPHDYTEILNTGRTGRGEKKTLVEYWSTSYIEVHRYDGNTLCDFMTLQIEVQDKPDDASSLSACTSATGTLSGIAAFASFWDPIFAIFAGAFGAIGAECKSIDGAGDHSTDGHNDT